MKRPNILFSMTFTFLLAFLYFPTLSQAQGGLSNSACGGALLIDGCVGACGNPSTISYVINQGISNGSDFELYLTSASSSLCPTHRAIAKVSVNGNVVASGDLTVVGSCIPFDANYDEVIEVEVRAIRVDSRVECVWLGELDYELKIRYNNNGINND